MTQLSFIDVGTPATSADEVDLILADCPWAKDNGGGGRGANDHYLTHSKEKIYKIITEGRWEDDTLVYQPASSAHLRLWATTLSLLDALWLMSALGFRYSTCDVWVKHGSWGPVQAGVVERVSESLSLLNALRAHLSTPGGLSLLEDIERPLVEALELLEGETSDVGQMACGQYRRSAHEFMLCGRRGPFARGLEASSTTSLIGGRIIPVPRVRGGSGARVHSRKPIEAYEHVERTSPYIRRVSLFERGVERPGWRFWGDEVGTFDNPANGIESST